MAPQASWPSSMPLGLQNHCLGSRTGVIHFFWIPDFQIFRFPDVQNLARAGLEPPGPKNVDFLVFLLYILMFELATACFV